ncbi:TolC family protein [Chlorobium sp.]|jgi:outer membrane protein|uniref:TolC family protein n=1 Tax=Chlorobium sp. TaxID=1095 RepID=UPI003C5FCE4F
MTTRLQTFILNRSQLPGILIASLLLLLFSDLSAAEPPQRRLSLRESISIALENASSLKKADNLVRLQGADVLRSYGSFLPKLSASAGYMPYSVSRSYSQLSTFGTETVKLKSERETLDLTLTTSLNLFNGFGDYAALQAALKKEEGAEFSLARARQAVVFDVTQNYCQVLLNQEILAIARENLLTAKDQLKLSERQFEIGLKSMPDLYQQQAETASSELSVNRAEAQLERSRLELLRRLRIDPRSGFSLEPLPKEMLSADLRKPDIDSLIALAGKNRNDLQSQKLESDAARWQIRQAASSWYPKLDLNFNVSTSGVESLRQTYSGFTVDYPYPPMAEQLENSIGYSVVLNLSWAIFDGFQTRFNVEQAKINHINQKLDYEDLQSDIALDLQQAAAEYHAAVASISSAKAGLKAAKAAYEGIKRKYDLGAAGFIELSSARAALFNAMSTLSQATYSLALQKNVLDFTSGTLSTQ